MKNTILYLIFLITIIGSSVIYRTIKFYKLPHFARFNIEALTNVELPNNKVDIKTTQEIEEESRMHLGIYDQVVTTKYKYVDCRGRGYVDCSEGNGCTIIDTQYSNTPCSYDSADECLRNH